MAAKTKTETDIQSMLQNMLIDAIKNVDGSIPNVKVELVQSVQIADAIHYMAASINNMAKAVNNHAEAIREIRRGF